MRFFHKKLKFATKCALINMPAINLFLVWPNIIKYYPIGPNLWPKWSFRIQKYATIVFIGNDSLPPLEFFQKIIQISGDNDTVIWCNMAQESPWSVLPGKGTRRIFKGMHRCSQVQMDRCSHRKKEVWKRNFLSTKVIKHRFSWIPF